MSETTMKKEEDCLPLSRTETCGDGRALVGGTRFRTTRLPPRPGRRIDRHVKTKMSARTALIAFACVAMLISATSAAEICLLPQS